MCATVFQDLEILHEGIQDESGTFCLRLASNTKATRDMLPVNATRFYILGISGCLMFRPITPKRALIRTAWRQDGTHGLGANIMKLFVALGLHTTRVDRRPSLEPVPFHDVYFVELERVETEQGLSGTNSSWIEEVEDGIGRVKDIGGEACLLGVW
jgi:hypothetical protein